MSRPYFDLKAKLNQNLDDQKRQVEVIEETIAMTKRGYSDSLRELEKISEEIREMDELGDDQSMICRDKLWRRSTNFSSVGWTLVAG